eukprot:gene17319-19740_t
MHRKQDEHLSTPTVVLFEQCPHSPNTVTFGNIYTYYDSIATCATQLAKSFPGAALVYLAPIIPFSGHNNTTQEVNYPDQIQDNSAGELELLHWHLSQNFLVHQKGLIVANNRRALLYYSSLKGDNIKTFHEQDSHLRRKDSYENSFKGDKLQTRTLHDLDLQINQIASSIEQKTPNASNLRNISTFSRLVAHQHKNLFVVTQSLHSQCAKHYLTRKYDAQCHPPLSLTHPFLVTGLGGAGTHYAARQLRMQGWRVLHEDLDSDGAVSWIYAANDWSVQLDYPYGALPPGESSFLKPRYGHVIHLVRNPLDQISSFTAHSNKSYNFVLRTMELYLHQQVGRDNDTEHVVERFQKSRADQWDCHRGGNCHLEFAALSWLHWNRFVHSFADATFRVDQLQALQTHLCQIASAAVFNSTLPLHRLMKTRRYCEIKDCPSVNEGAQVNSFRHSMEKIGFNLLDRAFGVCALNEALFRRSAVHKRHRKYTWEDIGSMDAHLGQDIRADAAKYGFKLD